MKVKVLLVVFMAALLPVVAAYAAVGEKPVLEHAEIEITAQNSDTFKIRQVLQIDKAQFVADGKIENIFSKPDDVTVSDFTIAANGKKLDYSQDEKTFLSKIAFLLPQPVTEKVVYQVEFTAKLAENVFTIPLLVPVHPTAGGGETVKLKYTAPQGNYIHETSFPIISSLPPGNEYVTVMANIPSHVKYVYGPDTSPLVNNYSIISGVVFIVLLCLIVWGFKAEQQRNSVKKASNGGAA